MRIFQADVNHIQETVVTNIQLKRKKASFLSITPGNLMGESYTQIANKAALPQRWLSIISG
jgi:hypothetical protein